MFLSAIKLGLERIRTVAERMGLLPVTCSGHYGGRDKRQGFYLCHADADSAPARLQGRHLYFPTFIALQRTHCH